MADRHGLAREITSLFTAGRLDLSGRPGAPGSGWDSLPEVVMARKLRALGATDIEVRLYITFTSALDRARDASLLWNNSAKLFGEVRWPFAPENVAAKPLDELKEVLRQYGVSQRHSPDSAGWSRIAQTLSNPAATPYARAAIYEGQGDAVDLLRDLQGHQDGKPLLPFLRGPKVGPMWVRMLAYPGEARITSLDVLPVAVDVQVRKLTEYLGVTDTFGQNLENVRGLIQDAWAKDVRLNGADGPAPLKDTCAALDPALWFYAKWGCTWCERWRKKSPISPACASCQFDLLAAPSHNQVRSSL